MRARRSNAAFTLIEMMVAIFVFALIMTSVIACWKCIIRGTEIGETAAAASQRARIGIKTIENALSTAEISTANLRYYAFLNDTSSKFASVSFAARLPGSFPGSGYYGDNVMRRVTFDVEPDNDHVNNLILTQTPLLAAGFEKSSPYQIVLARDVSVFILEFWDVKENDWETSYEPSNQLPAMIRITLGVGHAGNDDNTAYALITREVAMAAAAH